MIEQPSGTVTLVFTDIEGSTRLLRELGQDAYLDALAEHRRVVRDSCARHSGYEVDYEGDAFFYAFQSALQAVAAVEEMMREPRGRDLESTHRVFGRWSVVSRGEQSCRSAVHR